jgi:hypothetical protein
MCASPPSFSAQYGAASWKWVGRHNDYKIVQKGRHNKHDHSCHGRKGGWKTRQPVLRRISSIEGKKQDGIAECQREQESKLAIAPNTSAL